MKKTKLFTISLSLAIITGLITGCSDSSTQTYEGGSSEQIYDESSYEQTDEESSAEQTYDDSSSEQTYDGAPSEAPAVTGQVTAVEGNEVTLAIMPAGGGQNGGRPEGGPDNTPPDTADENNSGSKPDIPSSDEAPLPENNTSEAEEKVITIPDDAVINIEDGDLTKTGTLNDITVGSMLSISYVKDDAGNEIIRSVTVRNFSGSPEGPDAGIPSQTGDNTASGAVDS